MRMLKKTATLVLAVALGGGSAIGVAACGEDREGEVQFEGGTGTGTTGTTGTTDTTGTTGTTDTTETGGTDTSGG
jgi:hypothetical protein